MITFLFVIQFCASGICAELKTAHGETMVFESAEACRIELPFVKEARVGRLSCQSRGFEIRLSVVGQ